MRKLLVLQLIPILVFSLISCDRLTTTTLSPQQYWITLKEKVEFYLHSFEEYLPDNPFDSYQEEDQYVPIVGNDYSDYVREDLQDLPATQLGLSESFIETVTSILSGYLEILNDQVVLEDNTVITTSESESIIEYSSSYHDDYFSVSRIGETTEILVFHDTDLGIKTEYLIHYPLEEAGVFESFESFDSGTHILTTITNYDSSSISYVNYDITNIETGQTFQYHQSEAGYQVGYALDSSGYLYTTYFDTSWAVEAHTVSLSNFYKVFEYRDYYYGSTLITKLTYNLFLVDGWDTVRFPLLENPLLVSSGITVEGTYRVSSLFPYSNYALLLLTVEMTDELTEEVLSLTQMNLNFSAVTLSEVQNARLYLETHLDEILSEYHLSDDPIENRIYITNQISIIILDDIEY